MKEIGIFTYFFQIKACHHLSKALFVSLSRQNEELLAQIIEHLQVLANSDIGLPMVLRCLLTGKNWYFMKEYLCEDRGEPARSRESFKSDDSAQKKLDSVRV